MPRRSTMYLRRVTGVGLGQRVRRRPEAVGGLGLERRQRRAGLAVAVHPLGCRLLDAGAVDDDDVHRGAQLLGASPGRLDDALRLLEAHGPDAERVAGVPGAGARRRPPARSRRRLPPRRRPRSPSPVPSPACASRRRCFPRPPSPPSGLEMRTATFAAPGSTCQPVCGGDRLTRVPPRTAASTSRATSRRGVGAGERRAAAAIAARRPDRAAIASVSVRRRSGVSSASGTTTAAPPSRHPARVRGLVVGGRVRIGDQHGREAVLGELEDRAAGAGHGEVGGRQGGAERGQVVAQDVARAGRGRGRAKSRAAGDVQHAVRRVGEGRHRGAG